MDLDTEIFKMMKISSYVFFDIETTGLPWEEKNQTKITDLCFVVATRQDIKRTALGDVPLVSKFNSVFNPQRPIHTYAVRMTGLTNSLLQYAPKFSEKVNSIRTFLEELPKPVCLVAHNGNNFDFKILLAEFIDANTSLPYDLLCVDSLVGFRKLLSGSSICYDTLKQAVTPTVDANCIPELYRDDLITDDEDEWPDLNMSTEEWHEIDDVCVVVSNIPYEERQKPTNKQKKKNKIQNQRSEAIRKVFDKKPQDCNSYKLTSLYKRLVNKESVNAHRAEADCLMLLECVVALKKDFLPWADNNCKLLTEIKPLVRVNIF